MLKRILSLLIVAAMLIAACALAETPATSMTAQLTQGMETTAEDWYKSDGQRAMLTWCLIVDYLIADGNLDIIAITEDSYVGKSEDGVLTVVLKQTDDTRLVFTYCPPADTATYAIENGNDSASIETMLTETVGAGNYVKNSLESLKEVAEVISQIISGDN